MDEMKHRRLQELDRSDFEIVDGEPDIRGWDVRNATGQKIGEVEDLIIDAQKKKVRYMVVDLDDNELKLDHRKVLLPIGMAQLHEKDDDVILPNVRGEQLRALPDYDKDHLDGETERSICTTLGRSSDTMHLKEGMDPDAEFYSHDYYNDDNLYRHRMHEARSKSDSEYEQGLRLWEKRSEGGIIDNGSGRRRRMDDSMMDNDPYRAREVEENARMEMVRNRRNMYEQRRRGGYTDDYRDRNDDRYTRDERRHRRDNTIEGRIRDEGLRDG